MMITPISILQIAGLAFGGTGLCSYGVSVRGVDGISFNSRILYGSHAAKC